MLRNATFKARAIVLAGVATAAAVGAGLWRTDLLLSSAFGKALEGARPSLSFQPVTGSKQAQTGIAGDEGYWLTRAEVESPTPFGKSLVLGDRITISGHGGQARQLEIVDLKAVGTLPARAGSATGQTRLLLVTCRTVGETAGAPDQGPVRFIVEAVSGDQIGLPAAKTL